MIQKIYTWSSFTSHPFVFNVFKPKYIFRFIFCGWICRISQKMFPYDYFYCIVLIRNLVFQTPHTMQFICKYLDIRQGTYFKAIELCRYNKVLFPDAYTEYSKFFKVCYTKPIVLHLICIYSLVVVDVSWCRCMFQFVVGELRVCNRAKICLFLPHFQSL